LTSASQKDKKQRWSALPPQLVAQVRYLFLSVKVQVVSRRGGGILEVEGISRRKEWKKKQTNKEKEGRNLVCVSCVCVNGEQGRTNMRKMELFVIFGSMV
jgi:hypothetical protein